MKSSPSIAALASALAKAQGELSGAKKDAKNPAFGSMYADLPSVIDALKAALPKHGLSYSQFPVTNEHGVGVETLLLHESGEYLHGDAWYIPVSKANAHGVGSALTYARRYSLAAVCGLKADDDDGNEAAKNAPKVNYEKHTARQTAQDEFDALPQDAQDVVREWAVEIIAAVEDGDLGTALAVTERCESQEDRLALWSQLPSKARSALKKAKQPAMAEQA